MDLRIGEVIEAKRILGRTKVLVWHLKKGERDVLTVSNFAL